MIRPRNETEVFLLSITKSCETLNEETHTKPRETLEFKPTQPREQFSFKPLFSIEGSLILGLPSL